METTFSLGRAGYRSRVAFILALVMATLFILAGTPVVLAATPMCNGLEATLYVDENNMLAENGVILGAYNGTITGNNSGSEVIVTTIGTDIVDAQNGNNTICSLGGDDRIIGGNSTDWIDAGDGNNFVDAKNGVNTIIAGNGNNEIFGGSDGDDITTSDGNDIIDAGNGNNTVNAGNGTNIVTTGNQASTIITGSGNDKITGGNGKNRIESGAGDDFIVTTSNLADYIDGGPGHDFCDAEEGENTIINCEAADGNQDNGPIKGILIVKDTQPDSSQSFNFTANGLTPSSFSLVDIGGINYKSFLDIPAGSYTVTEAQISGFNITSIVCNDPDNGTTINLETATAIIDFDANEAIVCVFTNSQIGGGGQDDDSDGIANQLDNCPLTANPDQLNTDGDSQGNACDTDDDNDTILDTADNCPINANADQADNDGDGIGNVCDDTPNPPSTDDTDGDGINNNLDNCPSIANADQLNTDGDALGNACDPDDDNDTIADGATDPDGGGSIVAGPDNCPINANTDQADTDGDGIGNACDPDDDNDGASDSQEITQGTDPLDADSDNDGISDGSQDPDGAGSIVAGPDNCPLIANTDQLDSDNDGQGNACDSTPNTPNETQGKITVTKIVINNNGGIKSVADFALFVNATPVASGIQNNFTPGTYIISETQQPGYSTAFSGDCSSGGVVVLDAGSVRSCTITNYDVAQTSSGSSGGGGGGGGGSGGFSSTSSTPLIIIDSSIKASNVTDTSMTLSWDTNLPSSSYVIYAAPGQAHSLDLTDNQGVPPKLGYANATPEFDIAHPVTSHAVTMSGLTANTTYIFRLVSRGSLAYSNEYQITPGAPVLPVATPPAPPSNPIPEDNTYIPTYVPPTSTDTNNYTGTGSEEGAPQETEEPVVEEDQITAENELISELPINQPAAVGEAGGFARFWDWVVENWILFLLLLLTIIIAYWYYRRRKKEQTAIPPQ